jgi:hypothetical protein
MKTTNKRRIFALGAVIAVFVSVYLNVLRPWHRNWGATDAERTAMLTGDDIVGSPREDATSTHAITIRAPLHRVWPWLAQLGQDRGGFYSYEVLEDLAGSQMENTDRLLPDRQTWRLGDKLWMYPPDKLDGMGHALLARMVPGRALGFATRQAGTPATAPYDGSWSFVLKPLEADTTRLYVRGRAGGERAAGWRTFDVFVFEPMHFIMERKMMENVKRLAENEVTSPLRDSVEAVLFVLAALSALFALVRTFLGGAWQRPLLGFVLSVIAFHVLAFLQPRPEIGIALLLTIDLGVWFAGRPRPSRYVPHPPPPALSPDSLH